MKSIKVKIGVFPSINFLNKLVNMFSSLDSVVYVETENGSKRVLAKSLIGLLSLNPQFGQTIRITFYGEYAENDAQYVEKEIRLL